MAEIAVSVTIQVLEKALTLVAKESSRLFRLREEISWIETEMRRIQSYLKDAEDKRGQNQVVANFIRDVRNLAFDVEDTVEKYLPFPHKGKGFKGFLKRFPHIFSDYYYAHNLLAEIDLIKRRIQDLNRTRQTYGINKQHSDVKIESSDERRSFPHIEEPNITGLEDHTGQLVAKICNVDPGLRVISITGMPGLGKTTLAKKVYNLVRTNFESSAWVYVSERPVIKYILQDIARQVGLKIEKWEGGGEAILYEHLSQKRYVIVIDDIWQTSDWGAIKNAIPTNSENGSRIILTSRNRDVGVHVGGWSSLCELQPLGESDSKRLFEASLGHIQTINDPPGLEEIGEKILRRCSGVPLAIVVISGLLKLRERSLSAWKGVLEQFNQGHDELSKKLALSYVDLPANLKPCFLYFGLFPEDYEIKTFDLINLWAAEGFIKGSGFGEVEEMGEYYLHLLIARNLIQVVRKDLIGKVKSCRIHDILRSLCINEAKDINFFTSSTDLTTYNCESVRRVTTHGKSLNDHISSNHRTPKLRSFLCFHVAMSEDNLLPDFLKDVNLVRVLLLSMDKFNPVLKEIRV